MNSLSNLNKHFAVSAAIVLAANFSAQAQNPVESTHVDEKYAYTTVVYKNKAANDQEVLSSIENDFGIGDVIRVTLAPPPSPIEAVAASEPVYADTKKGEDVWLPGTAKSADGLTSVSNVVVSPKTQAKTIVASPKPLPTVAQAAAPKPVVVTKTVALEVPKTVITPTPATVQEQPAMPAPVVSNSNATVQTKTMVSGKSAKAHKSVKQHKKGGQKMKLKNRKHGKQRYSCPKF